MAEHPELAVKYPSVERGGHTLARPLCEVGWIDHHRAVVQCCELAD